MKGMGHTMKRFLAILLVLSFVAAPFVMAEGPAAPAKEAKEKPELKDITVNGTLTKEENKDAKGGATVTFVLVDPDGVRHKLPKQKDKDQAVTAALVDKNVTLVAKGTDEGGKVRIKKIVSITENNPEEGGDAAPPAIE